MKQIFDDQRVECADGKSACRLPSLRSNQLDKCVKQFQTLSKKSENNCKLPCGNFRYSTLRWLNFNGA